MGDDGRQSTWVDKLLDAILRHDMYGATSLLEKVKAGGGLEALFSDRAGGGTALHLAARQGDVDSMKLLRRYGAPIEARDASGRTALHVAAAANLNSVRFLLADGADAKAVEYSDEQTALHFVASSTVTSEAVPELLQLGSEIEARCRDGLTPLLRAVRHVHLDGIKQLLEAGANANAADYCGAAPLHALRFLDDARITECARLLLEAGADPHSRNNDGTSFWDMCAQWPEFREKIAALDAKRAIGNVLHRRPDLRDRCT